MKSLLEAIEAGIFSLLNQFQSVLHSILFFLLVLNEENENEVERLLMNGADLNATDENGNSALLLASEKGNFEIKRDKKCTKLE